MTIKIHNLSFISYLGREIPQVPSELDWSDHFGGIKSRWAIGRMKYAVEPGLYAVGNPSGDSNVFVSANYKMSFDRLRSQLAGRSGWILVLDTKGINVWCAAGKGTFGTEELLSRVESVGLSEIVNHRTLIVPQLGATGISAHEVKDRSGFKVVYGPVRAEDLGAFLDAGMKATDQMRRIQFPLWDRIVLIPVELVMGTKYALIIAFVFFLLGGLNKTGYSISHVLTVGLANAILLLGVYLAGVCLGPIFLPVLPGKAFSVKGVWIGLVIDVWVGVSLFMPQVCDCESLLPLSLAGWMLIAPAVTSFLVMNFTGASTYTSLSGVRKEMRIAVPIQLITALTGAGLWITALFVNS